MAYAKARSNGRFSAIYLDQHGKEKSAGTFDTQDMADQVADAQEAYVRGRTRGVAPAVKANMTVEKYGAYWLSTRIGIEPTTRATYENALKVHIGPRFGTQRMAELEASAVRALIVDLSQKAKGGSQSTQKTVRTVLHQMFKLAVVEGYRTDNPAVGIEITRRSRKKIVVLTEDQFSDVYKSLPTDGARLLADLIVSTGCRTGEAAVLMPSDLDEDGMTLTFERGLQEVGKRANGGQRFRIAETKTHDQRTISIDADLLASLRAWIALNDLGPNDLMFPRTLVMPPAQRRRITNDEADLLSRDRWRKIWQQACLDADLPFMPTAYQLRHTHASWLVHAGKDIKMVADRIGHTTTATTQLYVHRVGKGIEGADTMTSLRKWGKAAS